MLDHVSITVSDPDAAERFYDAAMSAIGVSKMRRSETAVYHPNYYAAFLVDPSGNRIEAVCHLGEDA